MVTTRDNGDWVLLLHRLPREPSAPRIALWRALRRLGALLLGDGLVALPASARNAEHLEWLAAGIEEQGGNASVWRARPTLGTVGARLAAQSRDAIDDEYRALVREASAARSMVDVERRRTLRRLRGELRRIGSRDYHRAQSADAARRAVEGLGASAGDIVGNMSAAAAPEARGSRSAARPPIQEGRR